MKNIYYYEDFDSDVVISKNQDFKLKKNYKDFDISLDIL